MTTLANFAPLMRDPDPKGAFKYAHRLWHERGIAVIFPGDCEKMDAVFIDAVANRLYGKRRP